MSSENRKQTRKSRRFTLQTPGVARASGRNLVLSGMSADCKTALWILARHNDEKKTGLTNYEVLYTQPRLADLGHVWVVGCPLSRFALSSIATYALSVTVIGCTPTMVAELGSIKASNVEIELDVTSCTSRLMWNRLCGALPVPKFLSLIEKRQKLQLDDETNNLSALLSALNYSHEALDEIDGMLPQAIEVGRLFKGAKDNRLKAIADKAVSAKLKGFENHKARLVLWPEAHQVGAKILEVFPECEVAIVARDDSKERYRLSIFTRLSGPDASSIAAHFGGKGYRCSADFGLDGNRLEDYVEFTDDIWTARKSTLTH